jgi:acetylglutamate kinase
MRHTEAIVRFLDGVGRVADAQFYLGLFHSVPRESFGVLSVDGNVVQEALDAFVLDLKYLVQLELYPTLVFGLLDAEDAHRLADQTGDALLNAGVGCTRLGGRPDELAAAIRASLEERVLPLVALAGDSTEARFDLVAHLLRELRTRKLIFIRREGRLGRSREDRISIVNLATDYDRLQASGILPPDQAALLTLVRRLLLEQLEHRVLASVASPLNLLKELFTVKGGGTLIRAGGTIRRMDSLEGVDRDRLAQLLESSFRKRLRSGWLDEPFARLYLEEAYRAAAIVRAAPHGGYLTKFAVEAQAQGEGLGRDMWQLLVADFPSLFWRAKPENRILPFYLRACDGMVRLPGWHVFWIGISPAQVPAVVEHALGAKEDFVGS